MDLKPIRTEADYEAALEEVMSLSDAKPGTPEGDRLEVLMLLVEDYEEEHYPIPLPDPIEAINYYVESRGLCPRDLEPYIGSSALVSQVLNRETPLTLRMIRELQDKLDISAEILVQEYELSGEMPKEETEEQTVFATAGHRLSAGSLGIQRVDILSSEKEGTYGPRKSQFTPEYCLV